MPTDAEIFAAWREEPAPFLAVLHAFHDRDGYLGEETLRTISDALRVPLAELYGTVTFYHHFSRKPPGKSAPRVCTGNICCMNGSDHLLESLMNQGATEMPCAGRCDEGIPVLHGDHVHIGTKPTPESPLPPINPGGLEECVFSSIRTPGRRTLEGYQLSGGYEGLTKCNEVTPTQIIQWVSESGLSGRGGAGFPTGAKWKAVAEAEGKAKYIVCNADEGEPGCFKDRAIMDHDPHALIEGMTIAARATHAKQGFIYLRYEYPQSLPILQTAIDEAESAGLLGDFKIYIRRGAGAYICGEEGSLLNSLEGKHPFPRNRPPYPVTHGLFDQPTAVNNVETLASIPHLIRNGPDWYRNLGLNGQAGTKIISLSGDIQQPGNYEVPLGFSLQTLLHDWAGGPKDGRRIQAVTMAGLSGGFLGGPDLNVTLDEPCIRSKGSFLGAGGIMVFDDTRDMVQIAHSAMEFFAEESCGKCFPCRIGTQRLTERLSGSSGCSDFSIWKTEIADIGDVMKSTSACGLGMAAPLVTESLLKYFPEQASEAFKRRVMA